MFGCWLVRTTARYANICIYFGSAKDIIQSGNLELKNRSKICVISIIFISLL